MWDPHQPKLAFPLSAFFLPELTNLSVPDAWPAEILNVQADLCIYESRQDHTMRFGSTAKVLLKCKLKYYRISEWTSSIDSSPRASMLIWEFPSNSQVEE